MMRSVLAATLFAAMLAAWGHSAMAQKAGGILKLYHRGTPPSASIHEEATISTVAPFMSVYNNLVMFDPHEDINSLETIIPDLATEWSWNEDGTKLTFTLREGVSWHDGKPFTSADVKCTWDRIQGKDTDRANRFQKNPRKSWYWNLEEVTTNGDYEATFHLSQPQPSLLALLAGGHSPVYPCHVDARTMRTAPIGTGPFKFVEMKQNESVVLAKNENYWKEGLPYLDGHEWTIIRSRSTRVLGFIAGEFDMTFDSDVTIPLLTPSILYNLISAIGVNLQIFTQAYIMTDGGPVDSTLFYALYLYRNAFNYSDLGYASAMSWILFVLNLALALFVFARARRWVRYEVVG